MKEKVLDLKKKVIEWEDIYELLDLDDRQELKNMKKEIELLLKDLSEDDIRWIDHQISYWYARYLEVEVNTRIRLSEG
ncbi:MULTISPECIES: hypothetical protein [Calditerrivibrio]|jgi:5-bromo-4-chloroindolyl phosphate hydrolysis protein|uniref:Uncharacterized protein n=1 Tax=Calditerrivibrio nitroreducens TaxID=477976 RepID=A0A2J6WRB0_9BACT|nr:MAG: hypothetical protein C0187_00625 [Calditerrivibrio nitroreducens]